MEAMVVEGVTCMPWLQVRRVSDRRFDANPRPSRVPLQGCTWYQCTCFTKLKGAGDIQHGQNGTATEVHVPIGSPSD